MTLSETAEKAITAYGGITRWERAKQIEAKVSVTGLAFTLKRRPFFSRARITQHIHQPFSRLTPIGRTPGISGILDGNNVRLEDEHHEMISERKDPRDYFKLNRRIFYWDDLDMAYFANYAFWNYFTLPALLMRDDIIWNEPELGQLEARFPKEISTHCRNQQFRFDPETGLLIQHNYTADIISRFARATNVVLKHTKNSDGVVYTASRRVTPMGLKGTAFKYPVLIQIEVHDFQLI